MWFFLKKVVDISEWVAYNPPRCHGRQQCLSESLSGYINRVNKTRGYADGIFVNK